MAIKFTRLSLFTQFSQFTQLTLFVGFRRFRKSFNSECEDNSANSVNQVNCVNSFLLFTICSLLIFLGGCGSFLHEKDILAVVNSEPITEEDLKYSLEVAHRKDLSIAGTLNLPQFIQKLVDDRLIIQETYRMGMEEYPEVQQALQAYILRESVVRLYNDEIAKKVTVSEEEIISFYKKNYERFSLSIIEVGSEENAHEIIEQLRKGADFKELSHKYSTRTDQKDNGVVVLKRNSLTPPIEEAVSNLKPGEFSDVIKIRNKYYVVKLISREEAPAEELKNVKANIERAIKKQKEKERSDEYLKYLREQKSIRIDYELLSAVRLDGGNEEIDKLLKNEKSLAEVNGSPLTVGGFVALAKSSPMKSKEEILNEWIDRKVVDNEAIRRHYEMKPDLKNKVYQYENQLLKSTFIKKVVIPQIVISDKTLEEYYSGHQKMFAKPASFKVQQITVKNMDKAQDILNNLQNGADFSWLAKEQSFDSAAPEGGDIGWITKAEMPEPLREILDTLKLGDISPIIKIDSLYRIIRLLGKREEEVQEFDKVKSAVYRTFFEEQLNALLNKYIAQLKTDAEITINNDAVQSLEKRYQK